EQLTVRGLCEEQPAVTRVLEAPPHDRAPAQAQDDVGAQGPDESLAQGDPGAFEPSALGDLRVELEPGAGSDLRLEVVEQSVPSHGRQSRRDLLLLRIGKHHGWLSNTSKQHLTTSPDIKRR